LGKEGKENAKGLIGVGKKKNDRQKKPQEVYRGEGNIISYSKKRKGKPDVAGDVKTQTKDVGDNFYIPPCRRLQEGRNEPMIAAHVTSRHEPKKETEERGEDKKYDHPSLGTQRAERQTASTRILPEEKQEATDGKKTNE